MINERQPKIVYFWPAPIGGIAEYAKEQVEAIQSEGAKITILCSPQFKYVDELADICRPILVEPPQWRRRRLRQMAYAACILRNIVRLRNYCIANQIEAVLFASFPCFLSPLWAAVLNDLKRRGIVIATMMHDPAMDYIVGPRWFNNLSNRKSLRLMDCVFTHHPVKLTRIDPETTANTTVIPHGPYLCTTGTSSRDCIRETFGFSESDFVLLAFGHIRDNKNLNLVLKAVSSLKKKGLDSIRILVAGNEPAGQTLTASDYKTLAKNEMIDDQCVWKIGFIADEEVHRYFDSADALLLTYSRSFQSASGVLNLAAQFKKPCLASSGNSSLRSTVEEFGLGVPIEPDSIQEIEDGIMKLTALGSFSNNWESYCLKNTWARNAQIVLNIIKHTRESK